MTDDNHLLRQCQHGDKTALDTLLRRYEEPIYRLAFRVLGDPALAQDAAAAALVKIWTKAKQWRGDANAGTWIYQLAYRTILDTRRSRQHWWKRWLNVLSHDMPDGKPAPDKIVSECEEKSNLERNIHNAIQQLTAEDRTLVHLYYFEDRGLKDIEEIMGVARATLKMRLSRARQRLRVLLEDIGESF